jgi:hypothetical protein
MPYPDAGTADVSSLFSPTQSTRRHRSAEPFAAFRRSLSLRFSHQNTDSAQKLVHRPSQRFRGTSTSARSPVERASSFHKSKPSSTSGTILRAVPASTTCAPAPKRAATMANHEDQSSSGCMGPACNHAHARQQSPTHMRTRERSSTTLSTTHHRFQGNTLSSPDSLAGVIGTYKDGQVQWHHSDPHRATSIRHSPSSPRSRVSKPSPKSKPRIELVIPNEPVNEKPLPTSPFFQRVNHSHAKTTSGEIEIAYNVSPPSASGQMLIRDSIVSPLSSQHVLPQPLFNAAIDSKTPKSVMGSPDLSHGTRNSSDDSREYDSSSVYSNRSSCTSNEGERESTKAHIPHNRASSKASSVASPVNARIKEAPPRETAKSDVSEIRHLASPSLSRRHAQHPPIEYDHAFIPSCSLRPLRVASGPPPRRQASLARTSTIRSSRGRPASVKAMGMVAVREPFSPNIRSPTLSEAAYELEAQLTAFSDDNAFVWDDAWNDIITQQRTPLSPQGLARADSVTYDVCPWVPPPQVPRKSSRRTTIVDYDGAFRLSKVPEDHIVSQLKRSRSKAKDLSIRIPDSRRMTTDTFILSPIPIPPKNMKRSITPEVAEGVIFSILCNLESLDDLFACAIVNRGFYRVFKRHELELMKAALRKMSPPAWEHREICYPGHDQLDEEELDRPRQEYTPTSFIQYYTRDMYIIAAIKSLIKDKCRSFVRPEISAAIVSEDPYLSARVDDALWRIWTFCKIFGSGKGREEDIVAQMDWLKGGPMVHQKTATHSALFADDFNETLASAPECFARGNEGGLSAEQLFDMMELWNCLGVLLQPIEGRTIQAREYGIYDNTNVRGGDIDGEELMLGK